MSFPRRANVVLCVLLLWPPDGVGVVSVSMDHMTSIDLTAKYADMALTEEAEGISFLSGESSAGVQPGVPSSWSIVGRFLTSKVIKFEYMQNTMASVWRPSRGVRIIEIRPNLFEFQFFHPKEAQRVIDDGPWSFENNMLACSRLDQGNRRSMFNSTGLISGYRFLISPLVTRRWLCWSWLVIFWASLCDTRIV